MMASKRSVQWAMSGSRVVTGKAIPRSTRYNTKAGEYARLKDIENGESWRGENSGSSLQSHLEAFSPQSGRVSVVRARI